MKKMIALLLLLLLTVVTRADSPDDNPLISKERLVLHTIAGDIVLALYPTLAPKTCAQLLKLARMGVYDTTHFFRVESGFVLQLGVAEDRLRPLSDVQKAAIVKIPAEIDPVLKHHPFILSMAHEDGNLDSAETSFSILLADAPHLDGKYTIFGHVERGFDVIFQLLKVPRDNSSRPVVRLSVDKVDVFDQAVDLWKLRLAPAVPVYTAPKEDAVDIVPLRRGLTGGLLVIALLSLSAFFLFGRLSARHLTSICLINVLVAMFLVTVLQIPAAKTAPWIGAVLFAGLIGTFKLMNRFESY